MQIITLAEGRRPVLVVSHERSGTHFTMNAVGACLDYVSRPWFDVDRHQLNINYYDKAALRAALLEIARRRPAHILKSHHEFDFFDGIAGELARAFHVIYVYRHPADALASYWRMLHTLPWAEGPRASSALAFAAAPPMARLMRYQYRQYPTMLARWANHVRGWLDAAARNPAIATVRYEDLAADYETVVRGLAEHMGEPVRQLLRPPRDENVISGGGLAFEPAPGADNRDRIAELAQRTCPELMARLGYRADLARAG
jgi:hypothetical protein